MKKTNFYIMGLLVITGMAACTGNSTTTTSDSSSTTSMNPGDSAVTTTTTVTHHRYTGNFTPKPETRYIDLRTHEKVTVRIDTVRGEIVNSETNQPIYLFVEPTTHDTIYGQSGSVVNNYIIRDESGEYRVDTVAAAAAPATPKYSESSVPSGDGGGDGTKTKTKVKSADGSKVKEKTK